MKREEFSIVAEKIVEHYHLEIEINKIFDEFSLLKNFLQNKSTEWYKINDVAKKWSEIFLYFEQKNVPIENVYKITSFLLCMPGTNAFVERIFAIVNDFWTENKSMFSFENLEKVMYVKIII